MREKLDHMKAQKEKVEKSSATANTRRKCWNTGYWN